MSDPLIRPFDGYVPRADLIEGVVAPPVSSITTDRYDQLVAANPDSILHLLGSAIDTGEGGSDPSIYDQLGATRLRAMIEEGILEHHPTAFYILSVEKGDKQHVGIVCEVDTVGLEDGRIKRHEETRNETEDLVARHLDIIGAHTDPVAMTYRSRPELDTTIRAVVAEQSPLRDFVADDGSRQRLWGVTDLPTLHTLERLVGGIPAVYITDGHHRTAAASRLRVRRTIANPDHRGDEPYNFLLTVLFSEDQLELHGISRAVKDLGGSAPADVLARIAAVADVDELAVAYAEEARPAGRGRFGMLLDGRWHRITIREPDIPDDAYGSLDAVLLQELILGPILGITDVRADSRLRYIPGPAGLAAMDERDVAVGFALHAAAIADVMAVADEGAVMPPKSTWFTPKIKTGLVVRTF
ncbi:MAG: DUF1015 domain-containing protein [bacterium]|nr:DUF1015 domain-containing protein [bacterium]